MFAHVIHLVVVPTSLLVVGASEIKVSWIAPQEDHELLSDYIVDVLIKILFLDAEAFNRHAADGCVADLPFRKFSRSEKEVAHVVVVFSKAFIFAKLRHLQLHKVNHFWILELLLLWVFEKLCVIALIKDLIAWKLEESNISHYSDSSFLDEIDVLRLLVLSDYQGVALQYAHVCLAGKDEEDVWV